MCFITAALHLVFIPLRNPSVDKSFLSNIYETLTHAHTPCDKS